MKHSDNELSFVYVEIAKNRHEDCASAWDNAIHSEAYVSPEPLEQADVSGEFIDSDISLTDSDALSV